jgi:hypothetical protein
LDRIEVASTPDSYLSLPFSLSTFNCMDPQIILIMLILEHYKHNIAYVFSWVLIWLYSPLSC